MSHWPAKPAARVLDALLRSGWTIKRQSGSHKTLARAGWPDYVFAFHDRGEIGPRMLARIAKHTGLTREDLEPREPRGGLPQEDTIIRSRRSDDRGTAHEDRRAAYWMSR